MPRHVCAKVEKEGIGHVLRVWLLIVEFAWSGPKRIKNQEPDKQTNINEALENRFNHAVNYYSKISTT